MKKSANMDQKRTLSQLRVVAQAIDKKIPELERQLDVRKPFSAPKALAKISSMSQDVVKQDALIKEECKKVDEVHKACQLMNEAGFSFAEKLKDYVSATESYFKQYGYIPITSTDAIQSEPVNEETEEIESSEDHDDDDTPEKENMQKPGTPVQKVTAPVNPNGTPKLEGLSQYTMSLLSQRMAMKQDVNSSTVTKTSTTSIPSLFEHNGFLCTPSLFPNFNDRAQSEGHASLASPVHATVFPEDQDHSDPIADPRSRLGFEGLASESPKTPDLQTPGLKEMMTSNKKINVTQILAQGGVKDLSVKHKASVSLFNEKQYEKETYTYDDGEPMEPELTYSLEALQEMTGMYNIKPHQPQAPTSTVAHLANKENTPTEPELLSERLAKLHKETAATSGTATKPRVLYGEMPPSPKLMMNYDYLIK